MKNTKGRQFLQKIIILLRQIIENVNTSSSVIRAGHLVYCKYGVGGVLDWSPGHENAVLHRLETQTLIDH